MQTIAGVKLLWHYQRISQRHENNHWGKQNSGSVRGNCGWVRNRRPRWHVSLHKFCLCEDRWTDMCVCGITYSVAPAAQQVVGQGVVWLQLDGFIQVILEGKTDGRRGEDFHHWFIKWMLLPLLSVLTWSVLLHQPTSISQTPLTHTISQSDHTLLAVTHPPSSFFFSIPPSPPPPPPSDSGLFFFLPTSYLPSAALYLALFHLLRVLKLLTEDKMLRAVVPHFVLYN